MIGVAESWADELDELVDQLGSARRSRLADRTEVEEEAQRLAHDAARSTSARPASGVLFANSATAGDDFTAANRANRVSTVTLSTSGLVGRRHAEDPLVAKPGRHDVLTAAVTVPDLERVTALTDRARTVHRTGQRCSRNASRAAVALSKVRCLICLGESESWHCFQPSPVVLNPSVGTSRW